MAESMRPVHSSNEDIDLLVVLERSTSFLNRYKITLIVFALAGAILGGVFHFLIKKKYYDSTLVLRSQYLTNAEELATVNGWNDLLENREYVALAQIFQCKPELLESVRSLTGNYIQAVSVLSGFTLTAVVSDPAVLPGLQKALLYGLANNDFVRQRVALKKENTLAMMSTVKQEMARLDSFQRMANYNGVNRATGNVVVMGISDTIGRVINLQQKLNETKEALKFAEATQVLQDFQKPERPSGTRGLVTVILGGAVGGLLGFIIALYRDLKAPLRQIRVNRENQLAQKGVL